MKTSDFSYFIERFNSGEMNEAEEKWFRKELEGNIELRRETELRRKADLILKDNDVIDLRQKLSRIEHQREKTVPVRATGKRTAVGIAAVVTGLILIGSIALFSGSKMTTDEIIGKYSRNYEGVYASRSVSGIQNMDYKKGIDYYAVSDYMNAARYFGKVLKADPGNMVATMYNGTSNYELSNYPVSEEMFHKVIINNDNLFIEDAQWYLALCYFRTSEDKKAIELLKEIKSSRSLHRKDAAAILRALK